MNTATVPASATPIVKNIPFYYSPYFIGLIIFVIIAILYYNGFFDSKNSKKEGAKSGRAEMNEHDTANGDADKFIASGGRSDSNGIDNGLIDRIHAINKEQRDYITKSKHTYRHDAREDAVPAVYSPEEQLQNDMYRDHSNE
jgi:hypothetical protein